MKTTLVAHLAVVGLLFGSAGAEVLAQDSHDGHQDGDSSAPRPRLKLPRTRRLEAPTPPTAPAAPIFRTAKAGEPPKLGVMIDVTEDGLVIADVTDDSVAQAAGVQAGDMLLKMDGRSIDGVEDIRAALAKTTPGETITLTVVREGKGLVKLKARMPKPEPRVAQRAPQARSADGHKGGFLGVQLGKSSDAGVVVDGVVEQSAAWFAGLDEGDVLLKIGKNDVGSGEDVVGAIASHAPGSFLRVTYERDGEVLNARVRLGSRTPSPSNLGSWVAPGRQGNVFFGNPGQGQLAVPQMRFFGDDEDIGVWVDDLGEHFQLHDGGGFSFDFSDLEGLEALHDLGDVGSLGITMEDGVLTIDRDGDVQVIDLSDLEDLHELHDLHDLGDIQGMNLQHLPMKLMKRFQDAGGNARFDVRVKRSGDRDGSTDKVKLRRLNYAPEVSSTTITVVDEDCCVETDVDVECCVVIEGCEDAQQDTGDVN